MNSFTKGQKVTNGQTLYSVLTAHKDGTLTLKALWGDVGNGQANISGGYLGYVYPHVPTDNLRAIDGDRKSA